MASQIKRKLSSPGDTLRYGALLEDSGAGGHGAPPLLGQLNRALDLSEPSLYARVDGGFGLIGSTMRDKKRAVPARRKVGGCVVN